MAERLKAHAWKACLGKPNVGSNPTLSAMFKKRVWSFEEFGVKTEKPKMVYSELGTTNSEPN